MWILFAFQTLYTLTGPHKFSFFSEQLCNVWKINIDALKQEVKQKLKKLRAKITVKSQ